MELQIGSKGSAVRDLQNKLNSLGYSVGSSDGIYGPNTASGVKKFQSSKGISPSGIVDFKTLEAINKAVSSRSVAGNSIPSKIMSKIEMIKSNKIMLAGVVLIAGLSSFLIYRKVTKK